MPKIIISENKVIAENFVVIDHCQGERLTQEACLNEQKDPYLLNPAELAAAVDRMRDVLGDPANHEKHREKFIVTAFVDIEHLLAIGALSMEMGAKHLRVYNAIDSEGNHFFFLVPITPDGRAREEADSLAAMCCCSKPPCPDTLTDRYYR